MVSFYSSHFHAVMFDEGDQLIPNLYQYLQPWEAEFMDSAHVWSEYSMKCKEGNVQNQYLTLEDLEDSWDRGILYINTLFQKIITHKSPINTLSWFPTNELLSLTVGMCTQTGNSTSCSHSGSTSHFSSDSWLKLIIATHSGGCQNALGGVKGILEHTLFKHTYFPTWEGLFWGKMSGFKESAV